MSDEQPDTRSVLDGPVEQVDTATLVPHPRNAREGDIGAIVESIKVHGLYRPLIVQRSTQHVLAGNHTLAAAKALGMTEVPVQYVAVDDDQALRILLVDNRTTDLARYDDAKLAQVLTDLATGSDAALLGTGFAGDDLDDLIRDLDLSFDENKGAVPSAERLEQWAESDLRQIILVMDPAAFERTVATLDRARDVMGHETNTHVVLHLLDAWAEEHLDYPAEPGGDA